jgi:hypothetical protein
MTAPATNSPFAALRDFGSLVELLLPYPRGAQDAKVLTPSGRR